MEPQSRFTPHSTAQQHEAPPVEWICNTASHLASPTNPKGKYNSLGTFPEPETQASWSTLQFQEWLLFVAIFRKA